MSIPPKLRPGPTGPRTPAGKQRSRQNSLKHGILAKKISSEIEKHDLVCQDISSTLRARNSLEQIIADQIAHNLAQRGAIDRFALREKEKANAALLREHQEAQRQKDTRLIPPLRGNDYRDQVPPIWCRKLLTELKHNILARGFFTQEDLKTIALTYGEKPTKLAKTVAFLIESYFTRNQTKKLKLSPAEMQEAVRKVTFLLEEEIAFQEESEKREAAFESKLFAPLPEDSVVDRISRYQAANSRELARLLANFEAVRRLKKSKTRNGDS